MIELFLTQAGSLRRIAAVSMCFCLLLAASGKADEPKNVLVLNSYHRGYEGSDAIMNGIEREFDKNYPGARLYFEYFDTKHYDPSEVFPHIKQWLEWKYTNKNIKFDVIIDSDNNVLEFLRLYRSELFPGVPVVFVGINKFQDSMIAGMEPITGIVETYDKEATIEAALKFHPSAEKLVIVADSKRDAWQDLGWIISRFEEQIETTSFEVSDMTVEQFLGELSKLDSKTIVLLPWGLSDVNDKDYTDELMTVVFQNCAGPIYTSGLSWIGRGPVGGCVNSGIYHGQLTAQMAIRILNGESAGNIPIIRKSPSDWYFDYDQLRRWGISLSELPVRSKIVNEPQSFYYRHWKAIWLIAGIIATLSLMVLVLSANIVRRRRAGRVLRASEQKFKDLTEATSDWVWEVDKNGVYTYISPRVKELLGYEVDEVMGRTPFDFMPAEEAGRKSKVFEQLRKNKEPIYNLENLNCHKDGHLVVLETNGVPIFDEKGQLAGYRGIDRDITERKRIEQLNIRRLEIEKTISAISSRFVGHLDIDKAINASLADMGKLSDASRAYVFVMLENGTVMDNTHEWCALGISPQINNCRNLPADRFPWWMENLCKGKAIRIEDISKMPPEASAERKEFEREDIKSLLAFPLTIDSELAGFIGFDSVVKTGLWDEGDILLLQVSSQIISNALKRHRAEQKLLDYQEQLKAMASKLSLTEERERRRIATELHDRISQSLVISKMTLEQLRKSEASEHIARTLDDVCSLLGQTIENSRLLTFDLSSPILNELGFETAVAEWLAEEIQHKHNIAIEFKDDGNPKPLEEDVRALLFRMVRELLINVVKHSQASKVKVSMGNIDSRIHICVEDNGVGFEPGKVASVGPKTGGFGLFSIRERLEQLGGRFEIKSAPGCGCRVTIAAPLKQTKSANN